jgi:rfaE bifunctional protein kinase chain/domain
MTTTLLSRARLEELLTAARRVRVAVVGDACLDVYWEADMTISRLARENPHFILPVVRERTSPGGGSNAAANVAALGVAGAPMLAVVGEDWRGLELRSLFPQYGIGTDDLLTAPGRLTTGYCKPLRKGLADVVYEDPHLYFENQTPTPAALEEALMARLDALLPQVDAVLVADYQLHGIVTARLRERLCAAARAGLPVVVDSRDRIGLYRHVILKPNEVETWAILNRPGSPHQATADDLADAARHLAVETDSRVCLTLGGRGCLWVEADAATPVPATPATGAIDTVGAGDCFGAALTVALAAGAPGPEAATFANLAAGVVVRKLGTTGTASPEEILARFDAEYPA